jgi:outer membrane protein
LLSRLQQLATKEQRVLQIRQEVFNSADTMETDWQRILAAHKRVELAARVADVEVRQFNLGLRTSTEVLDAQTKLADAQSSEIAAITDYQVAQVDIAFATGTILGASRIHWQPIVEKD